MNASQGSHTYTEITGQADAWVATLDAVLASAPTWADWLRRPHTEVIFTGCGSTYYLSLAAASLWQTLTGVQARAVPASELWLFPDAVLPRPPSLLVAVSRSGETTETLRAVDVYTRRTQGDWLVLTCYADRELARRAPMTLLTRHAEEASVAQTRSFTSMFVLAQAAACLAAGRDDLLTSLHRLPDCAKRVIAEYETLAQQLGNDRHLDSFVFLGSGPNYGLACEGMLKMKEMSLSASEVFHVMEFRHGPKSVVRPGMLIVALVSQTARQEQAAVLSEMRALGATVLAITDSATDLTVDYAVELSTGLDELVNGVLALPVMQLLAYYRAMVKGLNPDRPTNLEAVVRL